METREVPVSTLNEEEQKEIKRLNTMAPFGYNLTTGGERCKASKYTKKRMSEVKKKMWEDPEFSAKTKAAIKKACADPAVKARMSAASKKMWGDPEYRKKMGVAFSKRVVVTSLLTNKATTYASRKETIKEMGFDQSTIRRCLKAHQVAISEYSIRYENESDELKKKHEDMLNTLTHTPCNVQKRKGRILKSFDSSIDAVRWLRDEKQIKPNFFSAFKALTGKSKGYYGPRGRQVRMVIKH